MQFSDTSKRPDRLLDPIRMSTVPFTLDQHIFLKNVRSAKRGVAGGPSGMIVEHFRPLLDSPRPESLVDAVRLGTITALSKPDGGARSIVVGDADGADERCSGISNCSLSTVRPVNPRRV